MTIVLRVEQSGAGEICRRILDSLPAWFGIESANQAYIAKAEESPTIVASIDGEDVGLTVIERRFPTAAEVHLIAVKPERHRTGAGRAMLRFAEAELAREGVLFLQVKTLSPARVDPGYDKTRAFYLAYGFVPLEEFPELWDPSNPSLQMIKVVQPIP